MQSDEEFKRLYEDHATKYFRGELAVSDPESYSLEEFEDISLGMELTTIEVEEFLRQDFQSMPPAMQKAMMDMLCAGGKEQRTFWEGILLRA